MPRDKNTCTQSTFLLYTSDKIVILLYLPCFGRPSMLYRLLRLCGVTNDGRGLVIFALARSYITAICLAFPSQCLVASRLGMGQRQYAVCFWFNTPLGTSMRTYQVQRIQALQELREPDSFWDYSVASQEPESLLPVSESLSRGVCQSVRHEEGYIVIRHDLRSAQWPPSLCLRIIVTMWDFREL